MPKNRDYTGPERTPPSMAWLFHERAKSIGIIDRRRKVLDSLPQEIGPKEKSVEGLDLVIPLYELRIDPNAIVGKLEYKSRLSDYGAMACEIYRALREYDGKPSTSRRLHFR